LRVPIDRIGPPVKSSGAHRPIGPFCDNHWIVPPEALGYALAIGRHAKMPPGLWRDAMLKKFTFAALAAGAAMIAVPALAADSPVVGTWNTVADAQGQKFESTVTVAEVNGAYTVDIKDQPMTGPDGQAMPPMQSTVSDVKVDGANFSFKRTLAFGDMPMELAYSGSVDGNSLTAQVTSPMGAIPVTGTRQ
jgi:hypothetical protein